MDTRGTHRHHSHNLQFLRIFTRSEGETLAFKPTTAPGVLTRELIQWRIDYADAALALADGGPGDSRHRALIRRVAAERISPDKAVEITIARGGAQSSTTGRKFTHWDDYAIPGSLTLRSKLVDSTNPHGVEDHARFRKLEQEISRIRIVELGIRPELGVLDYRHMKAIHRRIFGDIYEWAGEQRIGPESGMMRFARDAVNFEAGDPAAPMMKYKYFSGSQIEDAASIQFAQLADLVRRTELSREEVIDRMSEYGGDLQTIHAFCDGNSRTFYVFCLYLFDAVGYPADPAVFLMGKELRERLMHARYQNQATGEHDAYFRTLDVALSQSKGFDTEGSRLIGS